MRKDTPRPYVVPPIPREDAPDTPREREPSAPRDAIEIDRDRLDALTWDQRELVIASRRSKRRGSRLVVVTLSTAREVRALRKLALEDAGSRGYLAADVARALAPRAAQLVRDSKRGASVKSAGAAVLASLVGVYAADPPGFVAAIRSIFGG